MPDVRIVRIVSIDFDGVIHSYTSGWQGAKYIPDPPVNGAIAWLRSLLTNRNLRVHIFSSRNAQGGRTAMKKWLIYHGLTKEELQGIEFPNSKPPSHLHIDDRAWTFTGEFPTASVILAFEPWNKQRV